MGNSNRTALLNKTHRVLKQQYTSVTPPSDRPLLEHLLFALVLENAPFEIAEKIYTHLSKNFFDWNEVRVSTVTELAEVGRPLPEPVAAASNIKRVLQGVFESTYSFDLETVKKQNISQALKQLERLGGTTPFSLAYVTQVALGGHAIPLDRGALDVLAVVGVISESEAVSGKVSGLERVIPKNKGVEFGSLLHQLAAEYVANPFSPAVRKLLLSINPGAKDRFPKRVAKKEETHAEPHPAGRHAGAHATASQSGKKPLTDGKGKHAAERPGMEKGTDKISAKGTAARGTAEKESEKVPERLAAKSASKTAEKSLDTATGKPAAGDHGAKAARPGKTEKSHRAAEKTERVETKKPTAAGKHGDHKHSDHKHSDHKHSDHKHSDHKPADNKRGDAKHGDAKHRAAAKSHPVAAKPKSASKQLSKRKPR